MPVFEYKGVSGSGKNVRGVVDAENSQAARAKLRKENIFLTELTEGGNNATPGGTPVTKAYGGGGSSGSIKTQDIAVMTRQLSTLMSAGIPLVESLSALVEQTDNLKLKRVISQVRDRVNEGASLADAMREHRRVFSSLYANMVMAGESSGTLDLVLDRLADFTEGQMKLRNRIMQIMAYPILMVFIGLGVMLILFTFVIPKVTAIYESINAALPTPTIVLIYVSGLLIDYWYMLPILLGLLVYIGRSILKREEGRYRLHYMILRLPVLGPILRMMAISRFSRTLGTLLASGVPLLTALDIVKNVISNVVISKIVESTRKEISEGASINVPLKASGEFPPMVTHMIAVGEKTGALEKMLIKVSDVYDNQIDSRVVALTALLEPLMIVAMAVSVGFIVMAVLLPLLELTSKVGV